ncbi:hypothetical protein HZS_2480, partial [Henneguya salminicola]
DIIISSIWRLNRLNRPNRYSQYDEVFRHTLFDYDTHSNISFLSVGLRILFFSPFYLIKINNDNFNLLVNKLIDWSINQSEPISTHSIKCLQIVAYFCLQKKREYLQFSKITDILIERILLMIEIQCDDFLIPLLDCTYIKNISCEFDKNLCNYTMLTQA